MRKIMHVYLLVFLFPLFSSNAYASSVMTIELNLPKLDVNPYHRPYVAVWLETSERKPLATLALWVAEDDWLKDLRQWWRKIGRKSGMEIDAVTGATKKFGEYQIVWDGKDHLGERVHHKNVLLNIEVVREEGDRTYVRKPIDLSVTKHFRVAPGLELGETRVFVISEKNGE